MLKSWKTRALATAGAVALAAPFAFTGGASAVPGTPTVTLLSPSNGPSPSTVAVEGTGCGTTANLATVELFVTGPGITTPTSVPGVVTSGGAFSGSVTISGRAGEVFNVVARCTDSTGTGPASSGGPTFTVQGTGLLTTGGSTTGGLLSTGTGGVTGTGLTSTSGATTAGATSTGTTGSTTGGAVPIPRQPNFTG